MEIKAFYEQIEVKQLNSSAIVLWHALLHIANKTGWQDEFSVATSVLEIKTGLNKQAIIRARKVLKDNGFIDFKKRGTLATKYSLKSLVKFGNSNSILDCNNHIYTDHSVTNSDTSYKTKFNTSCDTNSNTSYDANIEIINKQNKTKKDNTKQINNINSPIPPQVYENVKEYFNTYCTSFPKIREMSDLRKKAISRFIQAYGEEEIYNLFNMAERSNFLTGTTGWRASFDWILKPSNYVKILEGNYENRDEQVKDLPKGFRGIYEFLEGDKSEEDGI